MTYSISKSATPSPPPSPRHGQKTNTLAVTCLPKSFFDPIILDLLKDHFLTFGEINQWVPLPGFGRIIIVFERDQDAEAAKLACDPIILEGHEDGNRLVLRVYRADPNPLILKDQPVCIPSANFLRPPPIEKNFLISPPGSPPVGWEQIKEDPPNSAPLADDLIEALRKLQTRERRSSMEVLIEPHEAGVGIYVEDCDAPRVDGTVEEDEWVYGETMPSRQKWKPIATSMPPM
ncbi:Calcipressin, partial [Cyathus striatus]